VILNYRMRFDQTQNGYQFCDSLRDRKGAMEAKGRNNFFLFNKLNE